jgi:DNA repair exonuclease SbcCD ATPase subunit
MKLAEALALRGDAQKRIEQLRSRIQSSARYQEGEEPAENAQALVEEVDAVLDELESLIRRINRTNAATAIDPGFTLTDAIARRDVLRLRRTLYVAAAEAATGRGQGPGMGVRQMRSELRYLSALDVPALRERADDCARELRELDNRIQQTNWEVDLAEDSDR